MVFSHLDESNQPSMVDITPKKSTYRVAKAQTVLKVPSEIYSQFRDGDIHCPKGPVFQTAIIAGTMAAKKTSELIPMCHPLPIDKCKIHIFLNEDNHIQIEVEVAAYYKTGVEMEALTASSIAALTVYDMCKSISHNMEITTTKLMHKKGGKSDIHR